MLSFDSIELINFGPYKGRQKIEFPDESGVSVVYGENMRGKTSLLNGIRWALFGEILGRGEREISPSDYINWESQEEGNSSFSVVLEFSFEGNEYELTREFENVGPGADRGKEKMYLKENATVLGPDAAKNKLKDVLPKQVSRFFLFDGELLQQYQDLLSDQNAMGDQIKRAIERILGLPILKEGRSHLRVMADEAKDELQDAEADAAESREARNAYNIASGRVETIETNIEELESEIESFRNKKRQITTELEAVGRLNKRMNEREELEGELESQREELESKKERLGGLLEESWIGLIKPKLSKRRERLRGERDELEQITLQAKLSDKMAKLVEKAEKTGTCPVCDHEIHEIDGVDIQGSTQGQSELGIESLSDAQQNLDEVRNQLSALRELDTEDPSTRVHKVASRISELRVGIARTKDSIEDLNEQIDESGIKKVRELREEEIRAERHIDAKTSELEKSRENLKDRKKALQKLKDKVAPNDDSRVAEQERKVSFCEDLYDLFDDGMGEYRGELKERVEKDASKIFLQLTTEEEYTNLEITDNYGLKIVHESENDIDERSSGAEHVVALSLIGALQNNAPLKGPIIMDSPFGRLDSDHVDNVVKTLPGLTDQILLLVYKDELSQQKARDLLEGDLRREYTMERVTARHTELRLGGY